MKFIIENIPNELKSKNQWVCYRIKKDGEKTAKYMFLLWLGKTFCSQIHQMVQTLL